MVSPAFGEMEMELMVKVGRAVVGEGAEEHAGSELGRSH